MRGPCTLHHVCSLVDTVRTEGSLSTERVDTECAIFPLCGSGHCACNLSTLICAREWTLCVQSVHSAGVDSMRVKRPLCAGARVDIVRAQCPLRKSGPCAVRPSTLSVQEWTLCAHSVHFYKESGHNACALSTSIRDERSGQRRTDPSTTTEWTGCTHSVHTSFSGVDAVRAVCPL